MNDMLIIEDVSYRYKVREDATLKHVCLHVAKGEMLLLPDREHGGDQHDAVVVVNQHLLKR